MQLSEAYQVMDQALNQKKLLLVVGKCQVKYTGRATSKLAHGDRVILVKSDGSFLVHQNKGLAAINYQPPKGRLSCELGDGFLILRAARRKPKELLEAIFSKVHFARAFSITDDESLKVFGTEQDLSKLLMQDLSIIEPGLRSNKRESKILRGFIDITARDAQGKCVLIEVKRRTAGLKAVTQLKRYVDEAAKRKNEKVRGFLCAPEITKNAKIMLEREGLEYYKLDYDAKTSETKINGIMKKQKSLKEYAP